MFHASARHGVAPRQGPTGETRAHTHVDAQTATGTNTLTDNAQVPGSTNSHSHSHSLTEPHTALACSRFTPSPSIAHPPAVSHTALPSSSLALPLTPPTSFHDPRFTSLPLTHTNAATRHCVVRAPNSRGGGHHAGECCAVEANQHQLRRALVPACPLQLRAPRARRQEPASARTHSAVREQTLTRAFELMTLG
eukprot:1095618-Rhodomonas_salina.1